jgi:hypothetical protein
MPFETPLFQHIKSSFDKHYPPVVIQKVSKISKSKTPIKESRQASSKNKTPIRPKAGQRKIIKDLEVKTERSYFREKLEKVEKNNDFSGKFKTQREDNQEPEPPLSQDYEEEENTTFVINSNDLYGVHSEDD